MSLEVILDAKILEIGFQVLVVRRVNFFDSIYI